MNEVVVDALRPYLAALSRFTVGDGLLWAGWSAWMALYFLSVSEAYRRAGNMQACVPGRFIAAAFLAVAAGAIGLALVLGHGVVPTAWGVVAAICWLGGWMNLDRVRQTGKPWV